MGVYRLPRVVGIGHSMIGEWSLAANGVVEHTASALDSSTGGFEGSDLATGDAIDVARVEYGPMENRFHGSELTAECEMLLPAEPQLAVPVHDYLSRLEIRYRHSRAPPGVPPEVAR